MLNEGYGFYCVGITEHAQELLGIWCLWTYQKLVSHTPPAKIRRGGIGKATLDIYAPISNEIVAVNDDLGGSSELVNSAPYTDGWLFKIKAADENEVNKLLDAAAY